MPHSENARFLRESLIERVRRMTPVERLRAFVQHSQLMKRLSDIGKQDREKNQGKPKSNE